MVGDGCGHGDDVFLMSIVLFFGVFIIANGLKQFKTTGFLSQGVRGFLADFAVIIGILVMTGSCFLCIFLQVVRLDLSNLLVSP